MRPPATPCALPRSPRRIPLDATARLALLFEAGERLSLADDSNATLKALVSLIVPRLADVCLVALADAAGELHVVEALHRELEVDATRPIQLPHELVEAYRTGASSIASVADPFSVAPCPCARASAMFMPLKQGRRVLGAVALFLCEPDRAYDAEDIKLVEKLASRAALAIERARLFESDRRTTERITWLQSLTSKLSQAITLDDVASVIVHEASRTLLSCPVLVYLVRADGELLDLLAQSGNSTAPAWISLVSEDAHPLREAVRTGAPVWVASPEDLAARYPRVSRPEGFDQAFVCLPLVVDRRSIGALVLGFDRGSPRLNASEQAFVEAVGHQCAHALDRARLYSEAEDAIRVRDDFLAVASHELNTPLTSLKLALGHLRRDTSRQPEVLSRLLGVIERQADRLGTLVRDLLDVSKMTGGSINLELAETDFVVAVRTVLDRYALSFQKSGSPLSFVAPSSLVGRWDRKRIEQVASSLVSNAIKFGNGKPIEITLEKLDNDARLTVRDHGEGIPAERQLRIFERFERAVATPHYGGFGLGLWLARRVLEAMGGSIEVESQPGQGATFIVHLPLDGANDSDEGTTP